MPIIILTRPLPSDQNTPSSDNAMKMAREIVEYFMNSTLAINNLLNAQNNSQHEKYVERKPLKPCLHGRCLNDCCSSGRQYNL
jgi:hypothetical protein